MRYRQNETHVEEMAPNNRSILLVDDDHATLDGLGLVLRMGGFNVTVCDCGRTALSAAFSEPINVIVADICLPDFSGLDLLSELRSHDNSIPVVLITGFASSEVFSEAARLGAWRVLEKPIDGEQLLSLLRNGCSELDGDQSAVPHPVDRWVRAVLGVIHARHDPRTISAWGKEIGASGGTLRTWCYVAGQSPRDSLQFARLLRAVFQSRRNSWSAEDLLDVSDTRTLHKLASHLAPGSMRNGVDRVEQFLNSQRLIKDGRVLMRIRQALKV